MSIKDIKVDNRTQRVFVLLETTERIVYIPIKALHRVDYDVLTEATKNADGVALIDVLKKTKLPNGRNALVQFENIIQVANKDTGGMSRIRKPEEGQRAVAPEPEVKPVNASVATANVATAAQTDGAAQTAAPIRRKPGPKPKNTQDL